MSLSSVFRCVLSTSFQPPLRMRRTSGTSSKLEQADGRRSHNGPPPLTARVNVHGLVRRRQLRLGKLTSEGPPPIRFARRLLGSGDRHPAALGRSMVWRDNVGLGPHTEVSLNGTQRPALGSKGQVCSWRRLTDRA